MVLLPVWRGKHSRKSIMAWNNSNFQGFFFFSQVVCRRCTPTNHCIVVDVMLYTWNCTESPTSLRMNNTRTRAKCFSLFFVLLLYKMYIFKYRLPKNVKTNFFSKFWKIVLGLGILWGERYPAKPTAAFSPPFFILIFYFCPLRMQMASRNDIDLKSSSKLKPNFCSYPVLVVIKIRIWFRNALRTCVTSPFCFSASFSDWPI